MSHDCMCRAACVQELEAKLKMEIEESKTWEERLAETKARQENRERELREMGVLTGAEREAQLERAKIVPHMVNLHEDLQLSGQIIYFFENGRETTVGRRDATVAKDVKLGGLSILADHAIIKYIPAAGATAGAATADAAASSAAGGAATANGDDGATAGADGAAAAPAVPVPDPSTWGTLVIEPASAGARIMVNGDLITGPTELHHMHRVIFGTSNVFKVVVPWEAAAGR